MLCLSESATDIKSAGIVRCPSLDLASRVYRVYSYIIYPQYLPQSIYLKRHCANDPSRSHQTDFVYLAYGIRRDIDVLRARKYLDRRASLHPWSWH